MANLKTGMVLDYDPSDDETFLNISDIFGSFCEAGEEEMIIKVFQSCVFFIIFILGLVGNLLVIATFAVYRRLHLRSMTDIFLFNLAIADLLLLLTLPLQGVGTHLGWIFSESLCKATRGSYAINTYSGIMLLACISIDRYIVVRKAQDVFRLRRQMQIGGHVVSFGVWLAALLLSLPEIMFSGVAIQEDMTSWVATPENMTSGEHDILSSGVMTSGEHEDNISGHVPPDEHAYCLMQASRTVKNVTNLALIVVFCLSFVVMVTCYTFIAKTLCKGQGHGRRKGWQRQHTLKLMMALVLVFLVFQLPYTVVLSLKMSGNFCILLVEYITCTLAYARCCLNPVLYALVGVRFRNDVLKLLHKASCLSVFCLDTRLESLPAMFSRGSSSLSTLSPSFTHLPQQVQIRMANSTRKP